MNDPKNKLDPRSPTSKAASAAKVMADKNASPANAKTVAASKDMSSVGAELAPEASVTNEGGVTVLDAGGPYVSAAPRPTPAEAVSYPATGGLPDTGPSSKYVAGEDRGPKLYNERGERVDRDGRVIDEFGDRIPLKGDYAPPQPDNRRDVIASTRAEMNAGAKALKSR